MILYCLACLSFACIAYDPEAYTAMLWESSGSKQCQQKPSKQKGVLGINTTDYVIMRGGTGPCLRTVRSYEGPES